jgi:two-component system, cell cycle sensor histidine kinase and response regulator CckA
MAQGKETILLVEDDETVRKLAHEALESYDYEVLEAADGAAGLSISGQHEKTIHLLLTSSCQE